MERMATRVRSHCKINLGLAVGPVRADGFHGLTTIYQTLAVYDMVTVSARAAARTAIRLTADHPGVPRTATGDAERNTAYKMVAAALQRMGVTAEVEIDLRKRLPVQGGLGAGSANAVAALLGLERELGLTLPQAARLELAAAVGSDVPLFVLGGTVLGLGRGEEVYALPDGPALACVVALPGVGVSTKLAFAELDKRQGTSSAPETNTGVSPLRSTIQPSRSGRDDASTGVEVPLTLGATVDKLKELSYALAAVGQPTGAEAGPSGIVRPPVGIQDDLAEIPRSAMVDSYLALVRTGMENDFEEVVFSQHPSLRSTKRDLTGTSGEGALYAALSGSGSALFGLYESQAAARAAQHRVQSNGTQAILTETLPRSEYWATMFAE
jgi:4-diphosphocytidyl-2-C-methyl-D-erythritol kinase